MYGEHSAKSTIEVDSIELRLKKIYIQNNPNHISEHSS